jgi:hypothetical protein
VDSSLFRGAFCFADRGEKGPRGSAGRRLYPPAEAVAGVVVHPRQCRWFYLRNDGEMLPPFSQRVVTAAANAWRYGTPHDRQKNLEPLLKALEVLRKGGLTVAGVIAAIHRRRVLPLAERRLPLWEMTPEADLEGSRMSSDPLPIDVLHGWVAIALGKPDASAFSQPLMRPDDGCVTLVSVRSFFLPASDCPWSLQSRFSSVSRR